MKFIDTPLLKDRFVELQENIVSCEDQSPQFLFRFKEDVKSRKEDLKRSFEKEEDEIASNQKVGSCL